MTEWQCCGTKTGFYDKSFKHNSLKIFSVKIEIFLHNIFIPFQRSLGPSRENLSSPESIQLLQSLSENS
jgi:hypothetical protein